MTEPHPKLIEWLEGAGFTQHPNKPGLYQKHISETNTAYVDFRTSKDGKGVRYCSDKSIDKDIVDELKLFKEARDSFLSGKLVEYSKKPEIVQNSVNLPAPQAIHEDVIGRASIISKQLTDVIEKAKLYTNISGKKYVRVDGWETLGALLHCKGEITLLKEYKDGYWAEAVIKNQDDKVMSRGIGICLKAEKNWSNRDDYAILSMAQTRALGKAYRLGFSWIMNLAGYEPVAAEEM